MVSLSRCGWIRDEVTSVGPTEGFVMWEAPGDWVEGIIVETWFGRYGHFMVNVWVRRCRLSRVRRRGKGLTGTDRWLPPDSVGQGSVVTIQMHHRALREAVAHEHVGWDLRVIYEGVAERRSNRGKPAKRFTVQRRPPAGGPANPTAPDTPAPDTP